MANLVSARANLLTVSMEGFYWCKRCQRVVKVEHQYAGRDECPDRPLCSNCGSPRVVWNPPVLS